MPNLTKVRLARLGKPVGDIEIVTESDFVGEEYSARAARRFYPDKKLDNKACAEFKITDVLSSRKISGL